ncbi:zinc-binding dehydrogenase [Microbacterium sp. 1P10UB]|uniref:zinc-binding dehydrogenase n=1 Tax=unclassified Microbacterium TaxID=2609290 RepID=UPI0039A14423
MDYPKTSRVALVRDYDKGVELDELPVPPLVEGAVLVRVEAATGCGTDVHIASGGLRHSPTCKLPLVLGHEAVGRIVALGADRVTDVVGKPLREGDLIAWASPWCGNCYWCAVAHQPTLCVNANLYGFGPADQFPSLTGGFAEYVYVHPRSAVVHVPEGLSPALASSATCAFRTVVHAFETVGQLRPTDTLVIQGSGAVGLYATAYATIMGIPQIIVIGAPSSRLALAEKWGASTTLDVEHSTPEERRQIVLDATDGRGADIVSECSGAVPAFAEGLSLARRGGKMLVIGAADPRPSSVSATNFNMRQISVTGSISADISHFWRAFQLLTTYADRFDFDALLGNTYGLGSVSDALVSLEAGEMKPVIVPHTA